MAESPENTGTNWRKASSFADHDAVVVCLNLALAQFTTAVDGFLATTEPRLLILDGEAGRDIGQLATPERDVVATRLYRVVLERDPDGQHPFRPTTYFPRRPSARAGFRALTTPLDHLVGGYFNEDGDDNYDTWQLALAQMSIDAPGLYAGLLADLTDVLRGHDDAGLYRLFTELDFAVSIETSPRAFLTEVADQIRIIDAVNAIPRT